MNARRFLRRLREAGFRVEADADELVVAPAPNLTPSLRQQIQAEKSELLEVARDEPGSEPVTCTDCGGYLPLSGVRCPACRDTCSEPTCASCGATVEDPNRSVCDLCRIEREVAETRHREWSQVKPEESLP